jgi:hypothetical protein
MSHPAAAVVGDPIQGAKMSAANIANGVPKPLSAYRVGLLTHTIPMWVNLFGRKPEFEWGTAKGLHHVVLDLNDAIDNLATEIHRSVRHKIQPYLNDLAERCATARMMVWKFHREEKKWDGKLVENVLREPFPGPCTCIYRLGNQLKTLEPFFDLGIAVGKYWAQLDEIDVDSTLPDLGKIVNAAKTLAAVMPSLPKVLTTIIEIETKTSDMSPRQMLAQTIKDEGDDIVTEVLGPGLDAYVALKLVRGLDQDIQDNFLEIATPNISGESAALSQKGIKPRWDGERFELRVGDRIVRRVRPIATNVILILATFEEEGWPPTIYDPMAGIDAQRRHETIRSLNDGLSQIRFHGDGKNEGIKWEWL